MNCDKLTFIEEATHNQNTASKEMDGLNTLNVD